MKTFLEVFLGIVAAGTAAQYLRLARWPFRVLLFLALLILCYSLQGCAMLPIPFQPKNEQYNSNMAEGAWLVLDAVDTMQTMHIARDRNPQPYHSCDRETDPIAVRLYGGEYPSARRVLLTNIALATVHTMVTSWLDDEVAKHRGGGWYTARVVWHAASLTYSGVAVYNNYQHRCPL